jgi:RNA polymerase sigma-70 factor (ECF subfamily)
MTLTDNELVSLAKAGDYAAFERLVLDNQNKVYTLAVRMVDSREDAADLSQEAFLRAWQKLPDFQEDSSFSTWLYRLTVNLCIDHLRKQKTRRSLEPVSLSEEEAWEPADPAQDPQKLLEQAELRQELLRGMDALPEHYRRPLTMRELAGMSYQEIGEKLSLDPGTVRSRIARARAALRKILCSGGNFSPPTASNSKEKPKKEVTGP